MTAATVTPIDPDVRDFKGHPLHLHGAKVGHCVRSTLGAGDIFDETGRIIIRRSAFEGTGQTPATLMTARGPAVVATFQWSGLYQDGLQNIDVTDVFRSPILSGTRVPYNAWRFRSVIEGGYYRALYGPSPTTPVPTPGGFGAVGTGFTAVDGGFALGYVAGSMFVQSEGRIYFTGGYQDIFYKHNFQVEVGYASPTANFLRIEGGSDWPAFSATVLTDHDGWRGYPQFYPNHP